MPAVKDCVLELCSCACCGGGGDRSKCLCPCNKCRCARSQIKKKGKAPVRCPAPLPPLLPTAPIVFHDMSHDDFANNCSTPSKQGAPLPYTSPQYPPEVDENSFTFVYNESLVQRHYEQSAQPSKVARITPTETNKDLHYEKVAALFKSTVTLIRVNMWFMPEYNPLTAVVSKSKLCVVQAFPGAHKCSCSCPQAKILQDQQKGDLRCWHIKYLQHNKSILDDMMPCPRDCNSAYTTAENDDEENRDLMQETEVGRTRAGTLFRSVTEDSENTDTPDPNLSIYKVPEQLQWLVIDENCNHCWVFFSKIQQRVKCRCYHPNTAVHKNHAANVRLWTNQHFDENWKPKMPNKAIDSDRFPHSYVPIQQELHDSVRKILASETIANCPSEFTPETFLLPELCKCGEKWKKQNELYTIGNFYTLSFKKSVPVYVRKCVKGVCTMHFDGQGQGVFNYSGETLVSYAVFQDYHNCCVKAGMSWSSFVNKTNSMYNDAYCDSSQQMSFMSYPTFVKVLKAYMMLTKKTYDIKFCPCCGRYPKTLIMDGTDAAIAFRHLLETYHLWFDDDSPVSTQPVVPLSQRCFLKAGKFRQMLYEMCKEPEKFTQARWESLKRRAKKEVPSLVPIIVILHTASAQLINTATTPFSVWIPLLKVLCSQNSICPLIPQKQMILARALLAGIILEQPIPQHADFIENCPILAKITAFYENYWPPTCRTLLREIIVKCNTLFQVPEKDVEFRAVDTGLEFWELGHWYPHWPHFRQGLQYPNYYTAVPEPANSNIFSSHAHIRVFLCKNEGEQALADYIYKTSYTCCYTKTNFD